LPVQFFLGFDLPQPGTVAAWGLAALRGNVIDSFDCSSCKKYRLPVMLVVDEKSLTTG